MSEQREMELDEYLESKLPGCHLARQQLNDLIKEKDALAAHAERLRAAFAACIESDWSVPAEEAAEEALQLDASEALARRDARQRAGAVMAFAYEVWDEMLKRQKVIHVAPLTMAKEWIRRQAEESRDD